MDFIRDKNGSVKVVLTKSEAEEFAIYELIENDYTPAAKQILARLYILASAKTGFISDSKRISIKIFESHNGEYIIIYTPVPKPFALREKSEQSKICVFEFCDSTALFSAVNEMYNNKNLQYHESSLYAFNGAFCLIVNLENCKISVPHLREYADTFSDEKLFAAKISEHGKLLIEDNAIFTIGRLL